MELCVRSLAEFVEAVSDHPTPSWMFRGQARASDPLIPLLQRPGLCPPGVDLDVFERDLLDQFRREAVEDPWSRDDSAVYCYRDPGDEDQPRGPFSVKSVCIYHPPHIAGRFIAQRGCFTAHPIDFAHRPRWDSDLICVTIPARHRDEIRDGLRTLGIDRASLFPGLEGIASSIRARTCAPIARAN